MSPPKTPQRLELQENGVSTPHVLSIRSYAHTQSKHAKMGILSNMQFYPFRDVVQTQASHINQ